MTDRLSEESKLDREDVHQAVHASQDSARRQAASRLLARHQDRVYVWCYRYVRDHERALELSQEVLLKAFRGLPRYEPRARFSTWLYTITRNCCLGELRKPTLVEALDFEPDTLQSARPGPAQSLAEKELWRLIDHTLDPQEKEALQMRCFEGLSVDAITEFMKIKTSSGARGVLQRARRKLQTALDEQAAS
ncbi:MAG: sigma-70 family RNA polymerase sigma factor [Candidatus Krumholzibacteria bacterium]|nr:sigma-70 family RNA polymerase sigma factor [Candidatus Krumholzibacteria bacterium]